MARSEQHVNINSVLQTKETWTLQRKESDRVQTGTQKADNIDQ